MTATEFAALQERAEAIRVELQERLGDLAGEYAVSHLLFGLAEYIENECDDTSAWRAVRNMVCEAAEKAAIDAE